VWRLVTGWTVRVSNPGAGKIFRIHQDRTRVLPSLLYNGYRVFPGVKAARSQRWPPTLSSPKVKERKELYRYSTLELRSLFWSKLYLLTCHSDSYVPKRGLCILARILGLLNKETNAPNAEIFSLTDPWILSSPNAEFHFLKVEINFLNQTAGGGGTL